MQVSVLIYFLYKLSGKDIFWQEKIHDYFRVFKLVAVARRFCLEFATQSLTSPQYGFVLLPTTSLVENGSAHSSRFSLNRAASISSTL